MPAPAHGARIRRELELHKRPLEEVNHHGLLLRAGTTVARKRTRGHFAHYFLPMIGAEMSENNLLMLMSWCQAEGDAGRFNPLNTTQHMPGSTRFNSADVQNYGTFNDGVVATAKTLNFGADHNQFGYDAIRRALRKGSIPRLGLEAVEASAWGTGGLALRVYNDTPNAKILNLRFHQLAQ